jgi:hypothetical protein
MGAGKDHAIWGVARGEGPAAATTPFDALEPSCGHRAPGSGWHAARRNEDKKNRRGSIRKLGGAWRIFTLRCSAATRRAPWRRVGSDDKIGT